MASARRLPSAFNESTFGDGTRDYTSWVTWESATDNDLVTATMGEVLTCFPDAAEFVDPGALNFNGAIVNSNFFRVCRGNDPANKPVFRETARTQNNWFELRESYNGVYDLELSRSVNNATGNATIARLINAQGGTNQLIVGLLCTGQTATGGIVNHSIFYLDAENAAAVCCIADCQGATERGIIISPGTVGMTAYAYNCTAIDATTFNFTRSTGDSTAKNCLGKGGTTGDFELPDSVLWVNSDSNACSDGNAPGTNERVNQTFTFVDEANSDLHLAASDTGAKGFGADLSADSFFPFDDDVDGETITTWSIGADAQVAGAGTTNERWAPDAILASSELTGVVADVQDDPDSPDANWLTASGNNVATSVRVSFPTPSGTLVEGADLQEFRALVRQFDTGQSGTPTARVELWENGSLIRAGSEVNVTGSGQVISFVWNATEIATADGSLVECRVVGTQTGGGPTARNTVEVGAIEWNAEVEATGTTFEQAVGGVLSFVGALTRTTMRPIGGNLSFAGAMTRDTGKFVGGSLDFSGALTRQSQVTLEGILDFAGDLISNRVVMLLVGGVLSFSGAVTKQVGKSVGGTLSFAGSVTKQARTVLSGALDFAGSLTRQTQKVLTGALSFAGDLITNRVIMLIVGGALSFSGSLTRQTSKTLTGVLDFAGALTTSRIFSVIVGGVLDFSGALSKETGKLVAGALSFAGALSRQTRKTLGGVLDFAGNLSTNRVVLMLVGGVLDFTGALTRQTGKVVAGGVSFSGVLSRQTGKLVAGAISFSGELLTSTSQVFFIVVGGVLDFSGALTKRTSKSIGGALDFSGELIRQAGKLVSGVLDLSGALTRRTAKTLAGALSFAGALSTSRVILKLIEGALSFSGALTRQTGKSLGGVLSFAGTITRRTGKVLTGAMSFAGDLLASRVFSVIVGGVLSFSGALTRQTQKVLAGEVSFSGTLGRAMSKLVGGVLSFSGGLTKRTAKLVSGVLSFTGSLIVELATNFKRISLTLASRSGALTLMERGKDLTLKARSKLLTLFDRD